MAAINPNSGWNTSIENRNEKANYYFQSILEHQYEWYSSKANTQKKWHLLFAISVIILGALVTLLQVFEAAEWIKYVTAFLGAAISVLRALDSLLRPAETWQAYRKASENMKRERRLYVNNADTYKETTDEQSAYQLFVERVELVIAEEQQIYWQFHTKPVAQESDATADTGQK